MNELAIERGLPDLSHGFQTARRWSSPLTTNENFIQCVSSSLILSFLLVTVVLTFTLRNWFMALSIMVGVMSIVVQMFAITIIWVGRSLGMIESMCCILLVGLSVDFLAHVAKAYQEAPEEWSAPERARFASSRIGISVLSGAFTTAAGGVALLCAQITLFTYS